MNSTEIYYNSISFQEFKSNLNLEEKEIVKIGDIFVTFFVETRMFERVYTNDPDKEDHEFTAVLRIESNNIEEIRNNFIPHPNTLPMICEPVEWSKTQYGGYLQNSIQQESIITGSNYHNHKIENLEVIYKTINYMSKIKFNVNGEMLDYILNEGEYLLDLDLNDEGNKSLYLQRLISIKIAKTYSSGNASFYLPMKAD